MKSKASKREREIQQLRKELADVKAELANKSRVVRLEDEQLDQFVSDLTERIEWSTNRIVDETKVPRLIVPNKNSLDTFSIMLQIALGGIFCGAGVWIIITLFTNWSFYWIGGLQNAAVFCLISMSVACILIGIDVFREKDRNYLLSLFSALVALMALIVALIK